MLHILRIIKRKVTAIRPEERSFAAAALLCAPWVEGALRVAGLARTLSWVERLSDAVPWDAPAIPPERAQYIIDGLYRHQPYLGACLPRALLSYGLQRQRGGAVRFVIGVKRSDATIDAHAWVESTETEPTSDEVEPAPFAPILTVSRLTEEKESA